MAKVKTFKNYINGKWKTSSSGEAFDNVNPADTGQVVGRFQKSTRKDLNEAVAAAHEALPAWRKTPAPQRGEILFRVAELLVKQKESLAQNMTLEMGKIKEEGAGEVQEMIDIADFAVGLSRQLYGLTMHSERVKHRMYEQYHPLGIVGVISAFNFPVAVWAWNAFLAAVCGDITVWKPSSKAPLCGIAIQNICNEVLQREGYKGIFSLIIGRGSTIGERLINDKRVPLISATGSTRMGKRIGGVVGERLGKTILELGGNNAIIVTPNADLEMATRAIVFGAVGTTGQRCTTTRRVIVHQDVYSALTDALITAYQQVEIGNPLKEGVLMGPLIDREAADVMQTALKKAKEQGGRILYGGEVLAGGVFDTGTYVTPCICEVSADASIVSEETFAPILYMICYKTLDEAIFYHNAVPQGLSSAIFTNNLREAEIFLSHLGSDCGMANVNIGTSGAEIGGAFRR